ncbi:heterokaryon incompatibility protein-domain-containing protein [Phaeosphaeriaceae sp. PMI808]|nr:heterokaryon incompatibility protein-domain-containing protein [Phaeosphaeriaceae sp. PMI808]
MAYELSFPGARQYKYQPLDPSEQEIRLLQVRRDKWGEIHCDPTTFSLKGRPKYFALSYAWGPPTPLHKIWVDNGYLEIRDNLFNFLDEIGPKIKGYVWIDQISIDQSNVHERGHQVALMAKVFSEAEYVITWLGNHEEYYQAVIDYIAASPSGKSTESNEDDDEDLRPVDIKTMVRSLAILFHDVYFSRLWIIQEILLAKEVWIVVRRNLWISWTYIRRNNHFANVYLIGEVPSVVNDLFSDRRIKSHRDFQRFFESYGENNCADPRDKIYGFNGLRDPAWAPATPDYTKSVLEVFTNAVIESAHYQLRDANNYYIQTGWGKVGRNMGLFVDPSSALDDLFDDVQTVAKSIMFNASEIYVGFGTAKEQRLRKRILNLSTQPRKKGWWFKHDGKTHYYPCSITYLEPTPVDHEWIRSALVKPYYVCDTI